MKEEKLINYFEKYKYDRSIVSNSRTWFEQEVNLLLNKRINSGLYLRQSGVLRKQITPGSLYMYYYSPKHKETLSHYDMFPLVFPFAPASGGFLGLNMHYLTYRLRVGLLDELMKFKNTKGITERTKLKYSYDTLRGISKFPLAQHCVKHYLKEHIVSEIKLIPPKYWPTAMMLPVEAFVKKSVDDVWRNTGGVL